MYGGEISIFLSIPLKPSRTLEAYAMQDLVIYMSTSNLLHLDI